MTGFKVISREITPLFFLQPSYQNLFSTLPSQSLFWSGIFTFTHIYFDNGTNVYFPGRSTLETTLGGRIFDSLEIIFGLTYNVSWNGGNNTAPFWAGASSFYAAGASGNILVALGGRTPFRKGSIFESVESYTLASKLQAQPKTTINVVVFPFSINTGYNHSDGSCIGGIPKGSIELLMNRLTNGNLNNSNVACGGLSQRQLSLLRDFCVTNPTNDICSTSYLSDESSDSSGQNQKVINLIH
eukprot:TRINITY_DN5242_c0_g1_i1.p1 TRINITY_DN5242_c0_g1~~TRINITY_DN5242_c0_g1_i1.p1  ORF type:complete len:242 (-),score=44.31 TRINITY_DN5242_c0_g1_i1:147-872(-)